MPYVTNQGQISDFAPDLLRLARQPSDDKLVATFVTTAHAPQSRFKGVQVTPRRILPCHLIPVEPALAVALAA